MSESKKLKKMPRVTGDIPLAYKRSTIYTLGAVLNAHAAAIDYLAGKVEELEKRLADNEEI